MRRVASVLGTDVDFERRLVGTAEEMASTVDHLKGLKCRVVLTSGSFDLIHLGHVKYLARAKEFGDVLVVGVDSDAKIKQRKGDDRPMVPQAERLEMLAYQRPVDLIYLKDENESKWGLIRAVRPDVLVLTEDHSYSEADRVALLAICGRIEIVPRQSSITTSERIRQMYMHMGERLGPKLAEVLPGLIDSVLRRG